MMNEKLIVNVNPEVLKLVKRLKNDFEKKGIIITGFFGSFAKGLETIDSDLDLLFMEQTEFKEKYKGFARLHQLTLIKNEIEQELGRKVDLINENYLGNIAKKYILKEVIYV